MDRSYEEIMAKEAELAAFGDSSEQCVLCLRPVGRLPQALRNTTPEGLYQQEYNMHLGCAKHVQDPTYEIFMKKWHKLKAIKAKMMTQRTDSTPALTQADKTAAALEKSTLVAALMEKENLTKEEAKAQLQGPQGKAEDMKPQAPTLTEEEEKLAEQASKIQDAPTEEPPIEAPGKKE